MNDSVTPAPNVTSPLGQRQAKVLEMITDSRTWHGAYPRWVWGTVGATDAILASLARRGLITRIDTDFATGYGVYQALPGDCPLRCVAGRIWSQFEAAWADCPIHCG